MQVGEVHVDQQYPAHGQDRLIAMGDQGKRDSPAGQDLCGG